MMGTLGVSALFFTFLYDVGSLCASSFFLVYN